MLSLQSCVVRGRWALYILTVKALDLFYRADRHWRILRNI